MDWNSDIVIKTVNTVRVISAEAVERAKSGHPGLPMGAADYALVLFASHINFNPQAPDWFNRDRFILSAGHGSMLLYSLLHLFGYDLALEDIKQFRQWGSKTPGHPEAGHTPGVETTTGPLGQGFANGVGMAIAQKLMAERINTPRFPVISHKIFGLVSDGDLMEGVSGEAASLAGHLGLDNLVYIYDDNQISIEGSTDLAFSDDTARRFEAYNWRVLEIDGHDRRAVDRALTEAGKGAGKPTLIVARTRIGYGCPTKVGKADCHGSPLGAEELAGARKYFGWTAPEFHVDDDVYEFCARGVKPKLEAYRKWNEMVEEFKKAEPARARVLELLISGRMPDDLEQKVAAALDDKPVATRKASGACLQALARELPTLFGGSADLAPSNNTMIKGEQSIGKDNFRGRNLHFGVREHAMGSAMNGMALYGLIPYGGTFMVFSDYMRPAIRLAALMRRRVVYVFTHDSIFLGEDGPTHQPVEHLAALRAIPGLWVIRPADAAETGVAWCAALRRTDGPSALALSRQTLPPVDRTRYAGADGLKKGGYVLAGGDHDEVLLMASGSEVSVAIEVYEELARRGAAARVVSMPCLDLFEVQDREYRDSVLPPSCKKRVVIEAGVAMPWHRYAGDNGLIISMENFGASAPYKVLAEKYGFNKTAVLEMMECLWPELKK